MHANSPDGQSPESPPQPRWPLKPGVFVHVNKMHNFSQLSPLSIRSNSFKSSATARLLKYKRNKSKVYARLERLKDIIGMRDHDHVPIGITHSPGGGKEKLYVCFIFFTYLCFARCSCYF